MLPLFRYQGLVYRAHDPQWAFDPASGQGAALHGGRFNKPGTPALYTATSIMGAVTEAAQGMMMRLPPLTIVSYQVDHDAVLDLATPKACEDVGIPWADVACDWAYQGAIGNMTPSWAVAERVRIRGARAILVQSFAVGARSGDTNLVFWDWADQPPKQVLVIDQDARLPRNQTSWR